MFQGKSYYLVVHNANWMPLRCFRTRMLLSFLWCRVYVQLASSSSMCTLTDRKLYPITIYSWRWEKSSPEIHNSKPNVLELVMKTKVCHCCQTDCVLQLFYRIISHHYTCVWWWLISLLANPHHILDSQWNHFDNHGWPMICGFIQHCNAQAVVKGPYTMNLQSWSM